MTVIDGGGEHFLRIRAGTETIEILPCGLDYLLGRHGAATEATHAVGQHRQHHAFVARMGKHPDAILLLFTIADMLCLADFYRQCHGWFLLLQKRAIAVCNRACKISRRW